MGPVIREARAEDVPAIFQIRLAARENQMSAAELTAAGITPGTITAMILAEPGIAWVAQEGEVLTGFSMIDLSEACLFAAFMLPGAEGRGTGRALVAAAEAALFAQHREIWLETAKGSRAEGFYRHLGWSSEDKAGNAAPAPGDIRLHKARAA